MDRSKSQVTPEIGGPSGPPDIFQYLDYRQWLKDRIEYQQSLNKSHSQSWLAKRSGFKSSQMLSMILSGKRNLPTERVQDLASCLKCTELETEYFQFIVNLSTTSCQEQRKQLLEHLAISFRTGLFANMSDKGVEIFRHWYLPAIRELIEVDGFIDDPDWIASCMKLSREEVVDALQLLESIDFIKKKEGRWVRTEPSVHSFDRPVPILLSRFHMQMIDKSFEAVRLPKERRHFEALTISIPLEKKAEIVQMIQRLVRETDAIAEKSSHRDEVFQLNIQFFPLSNLSESEEL